MKHQKRRKESDFPEDLEFAAALYGNAPPSRSSNWQAERKAHQFCRQVQRALNLAIEEHSGAGIAGLFVEEVSPAPDCGRLLIHVRIPDGRSIADALSALRQAAPALRAEVASAITRKRAPELSFIPACSEGGLDE